MSHDLLESDGWVCPGCGEAHEGAFESCWKCGATRDGEAPLPVEPAHDAPHPDVTMWQSLDKRAFGIVGVVQTLCVVAMCASCGLSVQMSRPSLLILTVASALGALTLAVVFRLVVRLERVEARLQRLRNGEAEVPAGASHRPPTDDSGVR